MVIHINIFKMFPYINNSNEDDNDDGNRTSLQKRFFCDNKKKQMSFKICNKSNLMIKIKKVALDRFIKESR